MEAITSSSTSINLKVQSVATILNEEKELFDVKDIDDNYLPRNSDVLGYLYYLKDREPYHTKFLDLYMKVALRLIDIWKKTQIMPILNKKNLKKRIAAIFSKYKNIKRKVRENKCNDTNLQFMNNLFNATRCSCESLVFCHCSFKQSLDSNQYSFILNQSAERTLEIDTFFCNADVNHSLASRTSDLTIQSPSSTNSASAVESDRAVTPTQTSDYDDSSDDETNNVDDRGDTDFIPDANLIIPRDVKFPSSIQDLNINRAIQESMRYNTSFRQTASIINATLTGIGLITENAKGLVVTESLLRKRAKKLGCIISKSWSDKYRRSTELKCFFFDGVSAYNNMPVMKNNKYVADRSTLYDNIVIVQEPGGRYVGFTPTPHSDAESIFQHLLTFFNENNIDLSHLMAIGCDGAATNVGVDNGIIRKLEEALGRPLHHIVCLLHLLEVILKAIITFYYGENIVIYKHIGQINEDLKNCHNYEIEAFEKIELENMPHTDKMFDSSVLNSDQKYLYDMGKAVNNGFVNETLAARKPGDISGPRWTTLAARFLRLYVSTKRPTFKMVCVIKFIQNIYIPILFQIKLYPDWIKGSEHLFNILMYAQRLGEDSFRVIKDRIAFNSFFAHPENVLMCMLCDQSTDVKRAAYDIILAIRLRGEQQHVRFFKKPKINIEYASDSHQSAAAARAKYKHFSNLIDWKREEIFEPPFTKGLTIEQLRQCIDGDAGSFISDIKSIPAHSQKTEFFVQVVKNIVTKYLGQKSQDNRVKGKIVARELSSENCKKSGYKVVQNIVKLDEFGK